VRRATLQVFPKENFNARERLIAPVTHWTNWLQWSVVLRPRNKQPVTACPLTLITDDGEFLIVLHLHTADFDALQIYRRRDHIGDPARRGLDHGVFIKNITLREIWPADKFGEMYRETKTDASPEWFTGGTFEFSPDCRTLIHRTRWGNVVRINLQDGSVARN